MKRTLELGFSFFGAAALLGGGSLGRAMARDVPCRASTHDCYIGLNRINRQKSKIAAGVAQQQAETAIYRKVTAKRRNKKRRRAMPAYGTIACPVKPIGRN